MERLISYICEELDELERKAEKDGKLSMAEVQYMDTLAHAKKNLLKGEEMMDGYSTEPYRRNSYARRRDSMGRYARNSYAMDSMIDSINGMMDDLPEDTRRDARKFVSKLEKMM